MSLFKKLFANKDQEDAPDSLFEKLEGEWLKLLASQSHIENPVFEKSPEEFTVIDGINYMIKPIWFTPCDIENREEVKIRAFVAAVKGNNKKWTPTCLMSLNSNPIDVIADIQRLVSEYKASL